MPLAYSSNGARILYRAAMIVQSYFEIRKGPPRTGATASCRLKAVETRLAVLPDNRQLWSAHGVGRFPISSGYDAGA